MASVYVNLPNLNVTITGAATEVTADAILTELELKANPTEDQYSLLRFDKDGTIATVTKNTGIPSNTIALPVEIVSASGTEINITAGDLNVQLSDQGINADVTRIGDGSNQLGITALNEAKTHDADVLDAINNSGVVNTENSSTTPLGANNVFTGSSVEIKDYSAICVAAISDVDSEENGLSMQFSPDGVNWDHSHTYSVPANIGLSYTQAAELRYFRIVYTNGASAQSYFRLTVILKKNNTMPSRYTFDQGVLGGQLSDNVKSVIFGKTTAGGGSYIAVKVKPSGALTTEATLAASIGTRIGTVAIDQTTDGATNKVSVGNFPASQAVTGTFWQAIQPVSVASLPLPSGAATESTLSSLSQNITTSVLSAAQYTVSTLAKMLNVAAVMVGWDGTTHRELSVDTSGKLNVNASIAQGFISGTLKVNKITVGLTEVRATTDGLAPSTNRNKLMIKPSGTNNGSIFLIATGGSTSTGMEIIGPDRLEFLFDPTDYYLISDTLGQTVEIIEVE